MTDEDLNERKTFIKAVGMESTKFVNETLFLFLASIIRTSDGEDGTNFARNVEDRICLSVSDCGKRESLPWCCVLELYPSTPHEAEKSGKDY